MRSAAALSPCSARSASSPSRTDAACARSSAESARAARSAAASTSAGASEPSRATQNASTSQPRAACPASSRAMVASTAATAGSAEPPRRPAAPRGPRRRPRRRATPARRGAASRRGARRLRPRGPRASARARRVPRRRRSRGRRRGGRGAPRRGPRGGRARRGRGRPEGEQVDGQAGEGRDGGVLLAGVAGPPGGLAGALVGGEPRGVGEGAGGVDRPRGVAARGGGARATADAQRRPWAPPPETMSRPKAVAAAAVTTESTETMRATMPPAREAPSRPLTTMDRMERTSAVIHSAKPSTMDTPSGVKLPGRRRSGARGTRTPARRTRPASRSTTRARPPRRRRCGGAPRGRRAHGHTEAGRAQEVAWAPMLNHVQLGPPGSAADPRRPPALLIACVALPRGASEGVRPAAVGDAVAVLVDEVDGERAGRGVGAKQRRSCRRRRPARDANGPGGSRAAPTQRLDPGRAHAPRRTRCCDEGRRRLDAAHAAEVHVAPEIADAGPEVLLSATWLRISRRCEGRTSRPARRAPRPVYASHRELRVDASTRTRTGELVTATRYCCHSHRTGARGTSTGDGGWVYVSNSEVGRMGMGAVRLRLGGISRPTASWSAPAAMRGAARLRERRSRSSCDASALGGARRRPRRAARDPPGRCTSRRGSSC